MEFINTLTPRVKPWVIQSFLTFDSMDRTPKCDHSLKSCWAVVYCGAICFFDYNLFYNFGEFIICGLVALRSERVHYDFILLYFSRCLTPDPDDRPDIVQVCAISPEKTRSKITRSYLSLFLVFDSFDQTLSSVLFVKWQKATPHVISVVFLSFAGRSYHQWNNAGLCGQTPIQRDQFRKEIGKRKETNSTVCFVKFNLGMGSHSV